jgi:hypothetical protein
VHKLIEASDAGTSSVDDAVGLLYDVAMSPDLAVDTSEIRGHVLLLLDTRTGDELLDELTDEGLRHLCVVVRESLAAVVAPHPRAASIARPPTAAGEFSSRDGGAASRQAAPIQAVELAGASGVMRCVAQLRKRARTVDSLPVAAAWLEAAASLLGLHSDSSAYQAVVAQRSTLSYDGVRRLLPDEDALASLRFSFCEVLHRYNQLLLSPQAVTGQAAAALPLTRIEHLQCAVRLARLLAPSSAGPAASGHQQHAHPFALDVLLTHDPALARWGVRRDPPDDGGAAGAAAVSDGSGFSARGGAADAVSAVSASTTLAAPPAGGSSLPSPAARLAAVTDLLWGLREVQHSGWKVKTAIGSVSRALTAAIADGAIEALPPGAGFKALLEICALQDLVGEGFCCPGLTHVVCRRLVALMGPAAAGEMPPELDRVLLRCPVSGDTDSVTVFTAIEPLWTLYKVDAVDDEYRVTVMRAVRHLLRREAAVASAALSEQRRRRAGPPGGAGRDGGARDAQAAEQGAAAAAAALAADGAGASAGGGAAAGTDGRAAPAAPPPAQHPPSADGSSGFYVAPAVARAAARLLRTFQVHGLPSGLARGEAWGLYTEVARAWERHFARMLGAVGRRSNRTAAEDAQRIRTAHGAAGAALHGSFFVLNGVKIWTPSKPLRDAAQLLQALCRSGLPQLEVLKHTVSARSIIAAELERLQALTCGELVTAMLSHPDGLRLGFLLRKLHTPLLWATANGALPVLAPDAIARAVDASLAVTQEMSQRQVQQTMQELSQQRYHRLHGWQNVSGPGRPVPGLAVPGAAGATVKVPGAVSPSAAGAASLPGLGADGDAAAGRDNLVQGGLRAIADRVRSLLRVEGEPAAATHSDSPAAPALAPASPPAPAVWEPWTQVLPGWVLERVAACVMVGNALPVAVAASSPAAVGGAQSLTGAQLLADGPRRLLSPAGSRTSLGASSAVAPASIADTASSRLRGSWSSAFEVGVFDILASLCGEHGLPPPVHGHVVSELAMVVDIAWPAQRIIVEVDGPPHYIPKQPAAQARALAAARGAEWDGERHPEAALAVIRRMKAGVECRTATLGSNVALHDAALQRAGWRVVHVCCHQVYLRSPERAALEAMVGGGASAGVTPGAHAAAASAASAAGSAAGGGPTDASSAEPYGEVDVEEAIAGYRVTQWDTPNPRAVVLGILKASGAWAALGGPAAAEAAPPASLLMTLPAYTGPTAFDSSA